MLLTDDGSFQVVLQFVDLLFLFGQLICQRQQHIKKNHNMTFLTSSYIT